MWVGGGRGSVEINGWSWSFSKNRLSCREEGVIVNGFIFIYIFYWGIFLEERKEGVLFNLLDFLLIEFLSR